MATLVLTAVGTALGGPLGGALGALAGRSIDAAIIGTPSREGPRLKDLSLTTSSYGSALPRHFGKVRAAGTVIWATDLVEQKEKSGGGKGQPDVTSFSYSVSFAVALASRPIRGVGRIWADGNLLRGSAGDLKTGGALRVYTGQEDQPVDPLVLSDKQGGCPAFRGLAYVVFEDLQLADFGNRMPALTFEVLADDGEVVLADALAGVSASVTPMLPSLAGFSHDGGSLADMLATLDMAYPVTVSGGGAVLSVADASASVGSAVLKLPQPVIGDAKTDAAFAGGIKRQRSSKEGHTQVALRYYDPERDYQPGLQRSGGRSDARGPLAIEFPATLTADDARRLANEAAARSEAGRETLLYRIASIDPLLVPGAFVRVPGDRALWRIAAWEWRETGVDLELEALSPVLAQGLAAPGDAGATRPPQDLQNGATVLSAFELPWDGIGSPESIAVFAAASSAAAGWQGAALYCDRGDGALIPAGTTGRGRAVTGTAVSALPAASPHLLDRTNAITVVLTAPEFALFEADLAGLAQGANRVRVGEEILQFGRAVALGDGQWRLSLLLRGRGGTEASIGGHGAEEDFVLLDERLTPLDPAIVSNPPAAAIVALGNADPEPVSAAYRSPGLSLRPLHPVHARSFANGDGGMVIAWTRRARGAWRWPDGVDIPLNEPAEAYEVRFVNSQGGQMVWQAEAPELVLSAAQADQLRSALGPSHFEIRQIGRMAVSQPLTLPFAPR